MFYVLIFNFALAALVLSTGVFFIWCCFAFTEDRKRHPIYRAAAIAGSPLVKSRHEERHCA